MNPWNFFLAVFCCLAVAGCGSSRCPVGGSGWASDSASILWESRHVADAPVIDGTMDAAWSQAKPITVYVREAMGGDHPKPVVLRAVHTHDSLYILAQWPDETRSDMRDPYVWNAETKSYDRPTRPDDQFAIEFPMTGDFCISMLTASRSFTADVWHWKAGRGNPIGFVDDKYHVISQQKIDHPKAVEKKLYEGKIIYILRAQDAGKSPYKTKEAPTAFAGEWVDSFDQQQPEGSLADVRGKGIHDGKQWTLEMARKFNTGHPEDDAPIDPKADTLCAIAVLNDELYVEHSVSTVITLRMTGGPGK